MQLQVSIIAGACWEFWPWCSWPMSTSALLELYKPIRGNTRIQSDVSEQLVNGNMMQNVCGIVGICLSFRGRARARVRAHAYAHPCARARPCPRPRLRVLLWLPMRPCAQARTHAPACMPARLPVRPCEPARPPARPPACLSGRAPTRVSVRPIALMPLLPRTRASVRPPVRSAAHSPARAPTRAAASHPAACRSPRKASVCRKFRSQSSAAGLFLGFKSVDETPLCG